MMMRSVWITAALLAGLGGAQAASPKEEAGRCSAILDLLAQNRVADVIDIMNIGAPPTSDGHEAQTRYLEGKLAEVFQRTGAVVGRETLPDLAIEGSPALVVTERWTYAGGGSNHSGCVRYESDGEMLTSFSLDDNLKVITDDLSSWRASAQRADRRLRLTVPLAPRRSCARSSCQPAPHAVRNFRAPSCIRCAISS